MNIIITSDKRELGRQAARQGAEIIRKAIQQNGSATVIMATGASQFEMLEHLTAEKDINWQAVTGFHLDEYIGLPEDHPASFRKYLKERFVGKVNPGKFYFINGETDPGTECERLHNLISRHTIDVAFVGIGENAHLAFNDPPANFSTTRAYLVVNLDEACRKQQLGEGWFGTLAEVPRQAISMSVHQILQAKNIICSVPDKRKARAVQKAINGPVTPTVPASALQEHPGTFLYLDRHSASLII